MKNLDRVLVTTLAAVAIVPMVGEQALRLVAPSATAATTTTNLTVTANVNTNCNFPGPAATLAFGTYDPVVTNATADLDGSTTFNIRCTKGGTAVLSMNNGLNASGAQRRLVSGGTNFMNYQLYTSAARTTIWDTTNTVSYVATSSSSTPITVYGRVPQAQDVAAGSYSDTVVITATY